MNNDNNTQTLSLLKQIQQGVVDPKDIDKDARLQVVEALVFEGSSVPQIAVILKVSDRTIRRDIAAIRKQNALSPDNNWAKMFIGNMSMKAENHSSSITRLARSSKASVGEKTQAEYLAWKIAEEHTKILQTLGYLPLRPKEIVGDFRHHDEKEEDFFKNIKDQLLEIEEISEKTGKQDQDKSEQIKLLRHQIEKAEIEDNVINLCKKQKEEGGSHAEK